MSTVRNNRARRALPSAGILLLPVLLPLFASCSRVEYHPQPLEPARELASIEARSFDEAGLKEYLRAMTETAPPAPDSEWDLRRLTLAAFYHNPGLQVAYERVGLMQARLQSASRRINPTLNLPLEYHSDTSGGVSPWMAGLIPDFVYENPGKREARVDRARSGLLAARHRLRETAWDLRRRLHTAYLDCFAVHEQRQRVSARRDLLEQKADLLRQRYESGYIGRAAVTRAETELHDAVLSLSNLEIKNVEARHRLAAVIGLQGEDLEQVTLSFTDVGDINPILDMKREDFRKSALLQRAELRRAMAEYEVLEHGLRLEIEKQFPDITLSPGFVFDQSDKIWAIAGAWMLPLFHNNDGPIAEALAERRIMQARILELQADILNELKSELDRFEILQNSFEEAGKLTAGTEADVTAIEKQYEQGYSNRLELINAKLTLKERELQALQSRSSLLDSFSRLESVIQEPLYADFELEKSMEWLLSRRESRARMHPDEDSLSHDLH